MMWLKHKVRKPITGVFIGVFGVLETFWPGLAGAVVSPPSMTIINFVLGVKAGQLITDFANWKKPEPGIIGKG